MGARERPLLGEWIVSCYIRAAGSCIRRSASVNACVMLRPNKFDPPMNFFPKLTRSKILTPSFSHTAVRCGSPTLRQGVSTWTCCGGRLAPRRAHEGYTAEAPACARLVCQAYHSCPGRTRLSPPLPRLAHSGCPQSRATPPLTPRSRCWPMAPVLRQDKLTP